MDFYQATVADWIAADRATFVSGEYMLPRKGGSYFLVDILAVAPREQRVYLCEVTYSQQIGKIVAKMKQYRDERECISEKLDELAGIPSDWAITPWLFVLKNQREKIWSRLQSECPGFDVRFKNLEDVGPWTYAPGYRSFEPYEANAK